LFVLLGREIITNRILEARYRGLRIGFSTIVEGVKPFWPKRKLLSALEINGSVKIDKRCHIRIPEGSKLIISNGVYILEGSLIDVGMQRGSCIQIGDSTTIERFCVIGGNVRLGKECLIAPKVFMSSNEHTFEDNIHLSIRKIERDAFLHKQFLNEITLGDFSWIGVNGVIVGNIKLGKKTVVGANSFINKSFPSGQQVLVGAPARKVRRLRLIQ
jgi:acetyltransferase-like isoleucine patch superfamily enzyme